MTVEKTDDPAGLLPSRIHIKFDGGKNDWAAFKSGLLANTPRARIERLKRHEDMHEIAAALESRLVDGEADLHLLADIPAAEFRALYLDAAPKVIRDSKRQAGTKKNRIKRMPLLEGWLEKQDLSKTADELFWILPESQSDSDLYRDGNEQNNRTIIERNSRAQERAISFKTFQERLSKARKISGIIIKP